MYVCLSAFLCSLIIVNIVSSFYSYGYTNTRALEYKKRELNPRRMGRERTGSDQRHTLVSILQYVYKHNNTIFDVRNDVFLFKSLNMSINKRMRRTHEKRRTLDGSPRRTWPIHIVVFANEYDLSGLYVQIGDFMAGPTLLHPPHLTKNRPTTAKNTK